MYRQDIQKQSLFLAGKVYYTLVMIDALMIQYLMLSIRLTLLIALPSKLCSSLLSTQSIRGFRNYAQVIWTGERVVKLHIMPFLSIFKWYCIEHQ